LGEELPIKKNWVFIFGDYWNHWEDDIRSMGKGYHFQRKYPNLKFLNLTSRKIERGYLIYLERRSSDAVCNLVAQAGS